MFSAILLSAALAASANAAPPQATWRLDHGDGFHYVHLDGKLAGAWDPDAELWYPRIDGRYGDPIRYTRADREAARRGSLSGSGLSAGWIATEETAGDREHASVSGKTVKPAEALARVGAEGKELPDDRGKPHLSIVERDPAKRAAIARDFATRPDLVELAKGVKVNVIPADHWQASVFDLARNPDFQRTGYAALYQPPADQDGRSKPLALGWTYDPARLVESASALRKPGQGYDPAQIAVYRPFLPDLSGDLVFFGAVGACLLALAVLYIVKPKQ